MKRLANTPNLLLAVLVSYRYVTGTLTDILMISYWHSLGECGSLLEPHMSLIRFSFSFMISY